MLYFAQNSCILNFDSFKFYTMPEKSLMTLEGFYPRTKWVTLTGYFWSVQDLIQSNLVSVLSSSTNSLVQTISSSNLVVTCLKQLIACSDRSTFQQGKPGAWNKTKKSYQKCHIASDNSYCSWTIQGIFRVSWSLNSIQLSLQTLRDSLSRTTPYFVRCIRPNSKKLDSLFEKELGVVV